MLFNVIYDVLFIVLFNVCNDACSQYMFCALQELGCSANEKSLERYLGETQKKNFKHTNARYNTEAQLDVHNLRTWQLRDLLNVAGICSVLFNVQLHLLFNVLLICHLFYHFTYFKYHIK